MNVESPNKLQGREFVHGAWQEKKIDLLNYLMRFQVASKPAFPSGTKCAPKRTTHLQKQVKIRETHMKESGRKERENGHDRHRVIHRH
jgi:hypothetical protein